MSKRFLSLLPLVLFSSLVLILAVGYFVFGEPPDPVTSPVAVVSASPATVESSPTSTPTPTLPTATLTNTPGPPPTVTFTLTPTPTRTFTPPLPTPTHTATSTPTFTPTPPDAIVMVAELNLRAGPGIGYDGLGLLHRGDALKIQGRVASNDWIQVIPVNSNTVGWVVAKPEYVAINVELAALAVITPSPPPPTSTPTLTPTPLIPLVTSPPVLLDPQPNASQYRNRIELEWDWLGTLGSNDYFQVEIRNRYNATLSAIDESVYPIDVAWVKDKFYQHDYIDEAYDREYSWRIIVVRYKSPEMPLEEKDWTIPFPEIWVWDPPAKDKVEWISAPSEMRTLYVEPGDKQPPDDPRDDSSCPGCR